MVFTFASGTNHNIKLFSPLNLGNLGNLPLNVGKRTTASEGKALNFGGESLASSTCIITFVVESAVNLGKPLSDTRTSNSNCCFVSKSKDPIVRRAPVLSSIAK